MCNTFVDEICNDSQELLKNTFFKVNEGRSRFDENKQKHLPVTITVFPCSLAVLLHLGIFKTVTHNSR